MMVLLMVTGSILVAIILVVMRVVTGRLAITVMVELMICYEDGSHDGAAPSDSVTVVRVEELFRK